MGGADQNRRENVLHAVYESVPKGEKTLFKKA